MLCLPRHVQSCCTPQENEVHTNAAFPAPRNGPSRGKRQDRACTPTGTARTATAHPHARKHTSTAKAGPRNAPRRASMTDRLEATVTTTRPEELRITTRCREQASGIFDMAVREDRGNTTHNPHSLQGLCTSRCNSEAQAPPFVKATFLLPLCRLVQVRI